MPSTLIDDFTDSTLWDALQPGPLPSPEIVLADDQAVYANLPDEASMRVEVAGPAADGHFLERSFAPTDLTDLPELRMWFQATIRTDGSPDNPFLLRMELGSAAMPIGAPGNDWHRFLPAFAADRWQFVQMALDDLDPLVMGAVDTIRMTCVNTTGSWTGWLDDLIACRPEMIADVDAALEGLMDGQLTLGGPVPAQLHVPGGTEPAAPWFRLVHYGADYSDVRTTGRRPRTDFTDTGYRSGPESVAYDLHYRVEPVTTDRDEYAEMLEFALHLLGHRGTLLVNGVPLPLERIEGIRRDAWGDVPVLRYRVSARQDRGAYRPVLPVAEITLETELAP